MNKKKQTAVVIIPTYNEAKVIGRTVDYLFKKIFPEISDWNMKVLVVDDTSPDGTYRVVKEKQKEYDDLHLYLNEKKMGIGYAYVVGFRYAMKELGADVVIEFDSDLQHPPETIPVMLKEIKNGADYVLGSRKVKGGSNPKGWGLKRIFFSEVGGLVARFILFFPSKMFFKITDPTTGLKASRVKGFVDQINMDNLYSYQFGYKLQLLYEMVKLGAKVKEIPLKFQLRKMGQSKISTNTVQDVLRTVFLVRWHDPKTQSFLKFAVVGFVGFLINSLGLEIFRRFSFVKNWAQALEENSLPLLQSLSGKINWRESIATAFGAEMAIISNFTWNNLWTFSYKRIKGLVKIFGKFLSFNLTSIGAIILQFIVIGIGTTLTGSQWRQMWLITAIAFFVVPYNWLMYNKIIWKKKDA